VLLFLGIPGIKYDESNFVPPHLRLLDDLTLDDIGNPDASQGSNFAVSPSGMIKD